MDAALTILVDRLSSMARMALKLLPNVAAAAVFLVAVLLIGHVMKKVVSRVGTRAHKHQNAVTILARLAQWLIVSTGLLTAITIVVPSFKLGSLLQTMGLASIAVGFAFRDVVQNFLAGILILWSEPFRVDDQIIYKDFEGTVEDIQTRATFIRTYDGRRVVIPNAELFTSAVMVNTAFATRRLEYDVGIGVSDDVQRARNIILDTLRSIEGVLHDPAPDVLVIELADFSVKLRVRWWITPPRKNDALQARDAVLSAVKSALLEAGIDLPFPTTQVLLHDQTESTDGDRRRQREGWPPQDGATGARRQAAAR